MHAPTDLTCLTLLSIEGCAKTLRSLELHLDEDPDAQASIRETLKHIEAERQRLLRLCSTRQG
jgi:hypothetical protein